MYIRKHKKILIINSILILSILIVSMNQVFANEKSNTSSKLVEKAGGNTLKAIPIDNAKTGSLIMAAGTVTPTNTSFESAEVIQVDNTKKGNANNFFGYFYKFVPLTTGKYMITNYGDTIASDYVNFSVRLYDCNENLIASNIERSVVTDDFRRLHEIIRYKSKMSYIFVEGKTYYIAIDSVAVYYKFKLSFEQNIEESKIPLLSEILKANKIYNEAVEGSETGQYKIGAKDIFKSVIMEAEHVISNVNSTQTDINNALTKLNNALFNFEKVKNIDTNTATYEYEYDSVSHRLRYILKNGKRIVEFIYDDNGNLKMKKKITS